MRCFYFLFLFVLIVITGVTAEAQFYQYIDEGGNFRFTDDLGSVPENRRENVKRFRGVSGNPPKSLSLDLPEEASEDFGETEEHENDRFDPIALRESLRQEQTDLQEEYDLIEEAKSALGDLPGKNASRKEFDEYSRKVEEINIRIINYQQRLDAHENRVEKYNAIIYGRAGTSNSCWIRKK